MKLVNGWSLRGVEVDWRLEWYWTMTVQYSSCSTSDNQQTFTVTELKLSERSKQYTVIEQREIIRQITYVIIVHSGWYSHTVKMVWLVRKLGG